MSIIYNLDIYEDSDDYMPYEKIRRGNKNMGSRGQISKREKKVYGTTGVGGSTKKEEDKVKIEQVKSEKKNK